MPNRDPIEHVVVLMLENHSFDQMLGCMKMANADIDGVDPSGEANRCCDFPDRTHLIGQFPARERFLDPDPMHEHPNVLRQLDPEYGFIVDYLQAYPHTDFTKKTEVIGYYTLGDMPVLHTLARNFAVCDRWFSSIPGPTWPNRYFVHSGTSLGHVDMPAHVYDKGWHWYDQPTVFTRLSEAGKTWKIYHHGMPHTLTMVRQWEHLTNYHDMAVFFQDAAGDPAAFPQYSFIEPCYSGTDQNDQHPPSDVMRGEQLLGQTYNALRGNDKLWPLTLFVVLYDEHGGFYDHVLPPDESSCPQACAPDEHTQGFKFNRFGVRVPALLISPWISKAPIHTIFDHTSLLRYLSDKWDLGPLGNRTLKANSFGNELVKVESLRPDTPAAVELGKIPTLLANQPGKLNEHIHALISFSHVLEQELSKVQSPKEVAERSLHVLQGAAAQVDVALERFAHFIGAKKTGVL